MWEYTPRQISGFMYYAARRLQREQATDLVTTFNASRGDPKDVKAAVEKASKI